jgi:hypothetical protein
MFEINVAEVSLSQISQASPSVQLCKKSSKSDPGVASTSEALNHSCEKSLCCFVASGILKDGLAEE